MLNFEWNTLRFSETQSWAMSKVSWNWVFTFTDTNLSLTRGAGSVDVCVQTSNPSRKILHCAVNAVSFEEQRWLISSVTKQVYWARIKKKFILNPTYFVFVRWGIDVRSLSCLSLEIPNVHWLPTVCCFCAHLPWTPCDTILKVYMQTSTSCSFNRI